MVRTFWNQSEKTMLLVINAVMLGLGHSILEESCMPFLRLFKGKPQI